MQYSRVDVHGMNEVGVGRVRACTRHAELLHIGVHPVAYAHDPVCFCVFVRRGGRAGREGLREGGGDKEGETACAIYVSIERERETKSVKFS